MIEKFFKVSKQQLSNAYYLIPFSDWKMGVLNEISVMVTDGDVGEHLLLEVVEHERDGFDDATEFMGW